jgi:DNA polymerase
MTASEPQDDLPREQSSLLGGAESGPGGEGQDPLGADHEPGAAGLAPSLEALAEEIRVHGGCGYEPCETCTNMVPGEGPDTAELMLVGEAPGASEDREGRPFVGAAGRLLTQLLERDAGLRRADVFITNVVKARPPGNRDPRPDEILHHWPWLEAQVRLLRPRLIVTLGRHAGATFLPDLKITRDHGRVREHEGLRFYPVLHPAAALRSDDAKAALREDFGRLVQVLAEAPRPAAFRLAPTVARGRARRS